jgi:hypothetical protein
MDVGYGLVCRHSTCLANERIKEAENVPTAFSQMRVLALLVDFLFLTRYIESGVFVPHSAVGQILRRILRWKR